MPTLIDHLIRLTDHRDREPLDLSLAKALLDLTTIQRVVIARLMVDEEQKRWLDKVTLDAGGGGKVVDPLRVNLKRLPRLDDEPDRVRCLRDNAEIEVAWAGEDGPRIYYHPLLDEVRDDERGVLEIHASGTLDDGARQIIAQVHHVYRNMHVLLAYSDHDPLTGLLNRKSLDDTFYSAMLEELSGNSSAMASSDPAAVAGDAQVAASERRHRVPPNYWLATISVDHFQLLNDKHGHLLMEENTLLITRIMNNTFRTHDRLYRLGGDRFAVMFHCPEESLAQNLLERLRNSIERFSFPQISRATVSIGFTRIQADDTPDAALERTEQAIDYAQKNGRNQVCSHAGLLRRGFFGMVQRAGTVDVFD
ncbi:GGDEF domain-containing protein [Hylemonella gracilis]|nr:GGDEF domain-containing protein [Hylemonella gracilis]